MPADKFLKQSDLAPEGFACNGADQIIPVVIETTTGLVNNGDGTFTYTNEMATDIIIDVCGLFIDSGCKVSDQACLDTTAFPNPVPADPSSYMALPNSLVNGYSVFIRFDSGFVTWTYDSVSDTWDVCPMDFMGMAQMIVGK